MSSTTAYSALGTAESTGFSRPSISPTLPLTTRIYFAIRVYLFSSLVSVYSSLLEFRNRSIPSQTKTYTVRPSLPLRIYLPSSYTPSPSTTLPLYLNIHGGGFAIGTPVLDDHFCRPLADRYNFLVVSLNYRKAPSHRFPTPVHDVAALIRAVLDDTTLPIDHSKIVLGGFSAGGNLALAVSQFPDIRARIHALVPVYPVVDFSNKYKGQFRTTKDGRKDMLEGISSLFNWAYIPQGTDRTDSLLSPIYTSRQDLPERIFLIGAEYDYLCHEAEIMAKKLAGYKEDERTGTKWERNGIRWKMYWDMQHGFTHAPQKGELEEERKAVMEECWQDIGEWCTNVVEDGNLVDV